MPASFNVSRHVALSEPIVSAYLWNPPVARVELSHPDRDGVEIQDLKSSLVLEGEELQDGDCTLRYSLRAGMETGIREEASVRVNEVRNLQRTIRSSQTWLGWVLEIWRNVIESISGLPAC